MNGRRRAAPSSIRGIYLNAYAAGSRKRLSQLLALADRTEINTFVVDVKDEKGIHYDTQVELARQLAQKGEVTLGKLSVLADTLHAHGLHAVARIVVFKDPILSKAHPDWSVRTPGGALWVDKAGNTWVSAWEPAVWDYNIAIAREAIEAGFDEVQFDYVRFPEAFKSLPDQVHPKAAGTKTDAIVAFLQRARDAVHPLGGIVAADVFGLSPNDALDVNIGQQWEPILVTADHVLPMVYPSHYYSTHLKNVPRPNRMPYETVFTSVGIGVTRLQRLREAGAQPARVIPWLQA
ncbi:MAG: putative glycoside hydrolase, partial [Longimicrobiales bacterium]